MYDVLRAENFSHLRGAAIKDAMRDPVSIDDLKSEITKQLANRALAATDAARDDDCVFKFQGEPL